MGETSMTALDLQTRRTHRRLSSLAERFGDGTMPIEPFNQQTQQTLPAPQESKTITASVVGLCVLVFLCLWLIAPISWILTARYNQAKSGVQRCSWIKEETARLICFRELDVRPSLPLVEGTKAPPISHSPGQRSE
jgi:hypothetical protein